MTTDGMVRHPSFKVLTRSKWIKRTDSKSPLYKAPPAPPPPAIAPSPVWAVWGQGFGDWENRNGTSNGIDIGRRTALGPKCASSQ
jgi:hypothetical protein